MAKKKTVKYHCQLYYIYITGPYIIVATPKYKILKIWYMNKRGKAYFFFINASKLQQVNAYVFIGYNSYL